MATMAVLTLGVVIGLVLGSVTVALTAGGLLLPPPPCFRVDADGFSGRYEDDPLTRRHGVANLAAPVVPGHHIPAAHRALRRAIGRIACRP